MPSRRSEVIRINLAHRPEGRLPTVTLCSTTGNELLEVWYYGDLLTLNEEPQSYIVDSYEAPGLVAARDPESGEEFVIFDGGRHGYDNLFCDEHDPAELEHRPLKRYEIPASKLVLELGYSMDYEDEKEGFEPDEADTVERINGRRMPWERMPLGCERGRYRFWMRRDAVPSSDNVPHDPRRTDPSLPAHGKAQLVFHQEMHYLDRNIAEQTARECYPGDPGVYI